MSGDEALEAPSPTYTLMQVYETPRGPIVHADLFRIENASELAELGWDEAADNAVVLVEWPERAGDALPRDRLDLAFSSDPARGETFRVARITGHGAFGPRLARARAIHELLHEAGWADATRRFMQGDASSRAYERLEKPNGARAVLMIAPRRPDGPPIRDGKPYSAIAHLAEDIGAFAAVDHALLAQGFSAPRIFAADFAAGLAILEDFGAEPVIDANGPIPERYAEAAAVLAGLHGRALPAVLPIAPGDDHHLPRYDLGALMIEAELLIDWYAPHIARVTLPEAARAAFAHAWAQALAEIVVGETTWTLRDYHSPNLIWLADRRGVERVGLIDFQDCVLGHPAYDVVSLLQDARVDVPDALELKLLSAYSRLRRADGAAFDMAAFTRAYAILGAQRATKILGIFARLDARDRKPHYLAHAPRIARYLAKNLAHPVLSGVKLWYDVHLPQIARAA